MILQSCFIYMDIYHQSSLFSLEFSIVVTGYWNTPFRPIPKGKAVPIPLEQDTPSTAEQRREICALISATREAISGLGDSIQPLDRYLADVADALAETDGETREAKLE